MTIVSRRVRRTGFDCPLSIAQVFSWVFGVFILVSFTLQAFSLILSIDSNAGKIGLLIHIVLYLLSYSGMIIKTFMVTMSDPTDPMIELDRLARKNEHKVSNEMAEFI